MFNKSSSDDEPVLASRPPGPSAAVTTTASRPPPPDQPPVEQEQPGSARLTRRGSGRHSGAVSRENTAELAQEGIGGGRTLARRSSGRQQQHKQPSRRIRRQQQEEPEEAEGPEMHPHPPPATTTATPFSPEELLGRKLQVWWWSKGETEGAYYQCTVMSYNASTNGMHILDYPDEEEPQPVNLLEECVHWNVDEVPDPFAPGAVLTGVGAHWKGEDGGSAAKVAQEQVVQGRRGRGRPRAPTQAEQAAGGSGAEERTAARRQPSRRGGRRQPQLAEAQSTEASGDLHTLVEDIATSAAALVAGQFAADAMRPAALDVEAEAAVPATAEQQQQQQPVDEVAPAMEEIAPRGLTAAISDGRQQQQQQGSRSRDGSLRKKVRDWAQKAVHPGSPTGSGSQDRQQEQQEQWQRQQQAVTSRFAPTKLAAAEPEPLVAPRVKADAAPALAAASAAAEPAAETAVAGADGAVAVAEPSQPAAPAYTPQAPSTAAEAAPTEAGALFAEEFASAPVQGEPAAAHGQGGRRGGGGGKWTHHYSQAQQHEEEKKEGDFEMADAAAADAGAPAKAPDIGKPMAAGGAEAKRRRLSHAGEPAAPAVTPASARRGGSKGGVAAGVVTAERAQSSPAAAPGAALTPEAAPAVAAVARTASPGPGSGKKQRMQRGPSADVLEHMDPVVLDLLAKRDALQEAQEQYEQHLQSAAQAADRMSELMRQLHQKPITMEQLKTASPFDKGGDKAGLLTVMVGRHYKWADTKRQSFLAKHDAMKAVGSGLLHHWKALSGKKPGGVAPIAGAPGGGGSSAGPGKKQQQQQQQRRLGTASKLLPAAVSLLDELLPSSQPQQQPQRLQQQQLLQGAKKAGSLEPPAAMAQLPPPLQQQQQAVAAEPAAELEPILAFESTGNWRRDAAVQVLMLALNPVLSPLGAALELEQQLWEDYRRPDGTASLQYLRAVRTAFNHLSPEHEEHRPLLPYCLLMGLERPQNVARFTAEDVKAAEAKALHSMQRAAHGPLQKTLDALPEPPLPPAVAPAFDVLAAAREAAHQCQAAQADGGAAEVAPPPPPPPGGGGDGEGMDLD